MVLFKIVNKPGRLMFECPGCNNSHSVVVEGDGPKWGWNGSMDKPTFTPSILVRSTDFTPKGWEAYEAWRKAGHPDQGPTVEAMQHALARKETICHSYILDGNIQFLNDSTHELAGRTVPLPSV